MLNVFIKVESSCLIYSRACRKGHVDIVELLLQAGASVDAVGMYSWTPLLVATRGNFILIVEILLERSPNVNTVDKDGLTALAIACKEGYYVNNLDDPI
jgi:ankyrin repeat-rich membrane spanning protein